jgi:hypothetical protein
MGIAGDISTVAGVQIQPAPNLDRELNKTNQFIFGKEVGFAEALEHS